VGSRSDVRRGGRGARDHLRAYTRGQALSEHPQGSIPVRLINSYEIDQPAGFRRRTQPRGRPIRCLMASPHHMPSPGEQQTHQGKHITLIHSDVHTGAVSASRAVTSLAGGACVQSMASQYRLVVDAAYTFSASAQPSSCPFLVEAAGTWGAARRSQALRPARCVSVIQRPSPCPSSSCRRTPVNHHFVAHVKRGRAHLTRWLAITR
jgi:hypothetical protein